MIIKPLNPFWKVLDITMAPFMWIIGGFKNQSLQETHRWHTQEINPNEIDKSLGVKVVGTEDTKILGHFLGVFHMPIFGGWKNYIIFNANTEEIWHIGWLCYGKSESEYEFCQIQRLKLKNPLVKVLSGPKDQITYFFALNEKGNQIKLEKVAEGVHGDQKFKNTRFL